MKEQTYKGFEIFTDNLGRVCVYNPKSPYSRESDHKIARDLKHAKEIINNKIDRGDYDRYR